ncbi:hypothetical protein [Phaeodactylibacter sp.]|uniref:hypothetical protein n=1 Tax=Phaeodactylibacter sp. TaxID=1940289 RepID=UPI0025D8ACD7|nr:hypothetical protein [Phaeodactylibacter sp.]MCI4647139.1 hypothetical protein [Phaeodactylibacter sp.]MCI5090873.1 hypothetical protein [Phaeodactylibacter sp.]
MRFTILWLLLMGSHALSGQELLEIKQADERLWYIYFEGSKGKSVLAEFEDFLVLLEVPASDIGGNDIEFVDQTEAGERLLSTIRHYFPKKELRYIAHSHWHPHSLASVMPFLKEKTQFITTPANFEVIKPMIDTVALPGYRESLLLLEEESFEISDGKQTLMVYRARQENYAALPTVDYLYFYLEPQGYFISGCMFSHLEHWDQTSFVSGRDLAVYQFLEDHNLKPAYLVPTNLSKYSTHEDATLYEVLKTKQEQGRRLWDIFMEYFNLTEAQLRLNRDSIVTSATFKGIPAGIFNFAVFRCLSEKEFDKALQFAWIQVQMNPSDANAWDTLGEVYYFMGQKELAMHYFRQYKMMFPYFSHSGPPLWEKDYQEMYKEKDGQGD